MNIESKYNLHSIIAGLTTDHLEFFCKGCGEKISRIVFYGIDSKGVRLMARCLRCNDTSIFKIKTDPPLGPIRSADYSVRQKEYARRKFKKHLRSVGNTPYSKE